MKNNNTAVERDKAGMAFELNEKFKDCKTETHEYLIGKQRCGAEPLLRKTPVQKRCGKALH